MTTLLGLISLFSSEYRNIVRKGNRRDIKRVVVIMFLIKFYIDREIVMILRKNCIDNGDDFGRIER